MNRHLAVFRPEDYLTCCACAGSQAQVDAVLTDSAGAEGGVACRMRHVEDLQVEAARDIHAGARDPVSQSRWEGSESAPISRELRQIRGKRHPITSSGDHGGFDGGPGVNFSSAEMEDPKLQDASDGQLVGGISLRRSCEAGKQLVEPVENVGPFRFQEICALVLSGFRDGGVVSHRPNYIFDGVSGCAGSDRTMISVAHHTVSFLQNRNIHGV